MVLRIVALSVCCCLFFNVQAQTRSPKRGVSFNFTNNADLEALQAGTSWFYNWGTSPNQVTDTYHRVYGYEFCPMAWNGNWNSSAIRDYVIANPDCKYLLAFNEPNFREQANLTPRQAADRWPELMALARELGLKVISPACNYSAWTEYSSPEKWLDEFFSYVDIDDIDGLAIHSYMGWASATKWYVSTYIEKYKKPIWLTEFCAWDDFSSNNGGTALVQRREMIDLLEYLETEPMVAKYAWFIPRRNEYTKPTFPYMELLTNTNGSERGVLTETGMVWTYMSSYDNDFYHTVDACIEAEHYISRSTGLYLERTSDKDGVLNTYNIGTGGELSYNIDIPEAGKYTLRLRMFSSEDATMNITSASGKSTHPLVSTNKEWADQEIEIMLNAGKQQIVLKVEDEGFKLNYFVVTNTDARPNATPNPPAETPPLPPPTGKNLALNKSVESSSTDDARAASFVTDGKVGNDYRWESKHGQDNKYIIVDLGETVALSDIIINWEGAYASQYNVEVSTDKEDWTSVFATSTGSGGEERIIIDNVNGRYIKINCIKRATQYGFSIYEVEVYGESKGSRIVDEKEDVSIFFNPINNTLFIESSQPPEHIDLFNMTGAKLLEKRDVSSINIEMLAPGMYLAQVTFVTGEKMCQKIIKK